MAGSQVSVLNLRVLIQFFYIAPETHLLRGKNTIILLFSKMVSFARFEFFLFAH
jgi:hypothetical protein